MIRLPLATFFTIFTFSLFALVSQNKISSFASCSLQDAANLVLAEEEHHDQQLQMSKGGAGRA